MSLKNTHSASALGDTSDNRRIKGFSKIHSRRVSRRAAAAAIKASQAS